ncbi:hypothetical protein F5X68DRAFT_172361 [Plectosphaerella plurivora]|uniref:Uncharacterized protein n=1 Tax=Plectosphaerella plurivora TaxID=936078 RepID=A0A9P8V807_9PEZI|nr:hypothetical protein F5X68DRAFT_172361 [Plectosphaerella plurivora]
MAGNHRDAQRLRQGLNPLLTQSLGAPYHSPHPPPLSAISLTSSHLQSAHPTPTGSAIQPYNPQEWIGSPSVASERPRQYPESQVSPPPPPYSPPYQQRPVSIHMESSPSANTSAARMPPTNLHRPSPEPVGTASFPPPPGRGGSRERRFGIPSLRRHRDQDQSASPEPMPPFSIARHAPPPIQIPLAHPMPERGHPVTPGAPGARRAVSAGALDTPVSARSRSGSQTRWEPGMPLPPPPPGPPPASSRSQSAQSGSRSAEPVSSPPTRRRPPSNGSALGPVPPTPADWVDQDGRPATSSRGRSPALTIDTAVASSSSASADPSMGGPLSSGSLNRTGAVRHDKTIVQRRAESRNRGHGSIDGHVQPVELTDIVVPGASTLLRRRTINKSTPRSAGRTTSDTPGTGDSNLTPKALGSSQHQEASTPPFSPNQLQKAPMRDHLPNVAPKALPTPPPQSRSGSTSRARATTPASGGGEAQSAIAELRQASVTQTSSQFCRASIERFEAFAVSEASATSDADRIRLFADFIVTESRIRRERYSPAIGAMGSEIFDLTRDLFRPMSHRRESGVFQGQSDHTPRSAEAGNRSQRTSLEAPSPDVAGPSSAPTSAGLLNTSGSNAGPSNTGTWQSSYMPSLSPILSMSNSGNGDNDSRGRPSSRWWESDSAGQAGQVLERSKRESKYMGVHKEAREALQWANTPIEQDAPSFPDSGSSSSYPAEKTGWHDESMLTPQPLRNSAQSLASSSTPTSPNAALLDISRLVTLPPPYPRHHPAVNNSHPELASTKTAVRQISDFSDVDRTKERFAQTSLKKREEAAKASLERRSALRTNLQREINSGNMSFAEASSIEQDSIQSEKESEKALGKADFEHFQSQVVVPLNELLTSRIAKATALFDELANNLFDNVESAADLPQEEGDDKPELLEKLALLKWIFEARETLHRAIYDLLSDRNDRYREVILTPYRLAKNEDKIASARAFFAEDAAKRQLAFASEVLERTEALQRIVEENVARGVEVQLSAFWDIAPALRSVLEKVPADLGGRGFGVQIPGQEYQENPSYHQHPLQYLYSLLMHAEQSTYQFIESQTNLLCKLHEVNEALVHAQARVLAVQEAGGEDEAAREDSAKKLTRAREQQLTSDLQEKVQVVQGQWQSALGEALRSTRQTVGEWLLQTGGWDESLEGGGVGSL